MKRTILNLQTESYQGVDSLPREGTILDPSQSNKGGNHVTNYPSALPMGEFSFAANQIARKMSTLWMDSVFLLKRNRILGREHGDNKKACLVHDENTTLNEYETIHPIKSLTMGNLDRTGVKTFLQST